MPTWGGVSLQVTGTNGAVEIEPFLPHVGGTDASGEVFLRDRRQPRRVAARRVPGPRSGTSGPAKPGTTPAVVPQPDGAVGLRTLRIVDAARRSAASGQAVEL